MRRRPRFGPAGTPTEVRSREKRTRKPRGVCTWLGFDNQQPTTWLRFDKQQIVGNADLERQFAADEVTCQGEVAKADTSSALSVHQAEEAIYRGCMSRRGYYERQ